MLQQQCRVPSQCTHAIPRIDFGQSTREVIFGVLNSDAGNGGLIALDAKGNAAWTFNSSGMSVEHGVR